MPDEPHQNKLPPAAAAESDQDTSVIRDAPTPAATGAPALGEPTPVNQLTPEEQMALFEKELKEKDWGHQPC